MRLKPACLVISPRGSSFLPQDLLRGDLGSLSLYSQAGSWPLEPCVLPSFGLFCPSGSHNSAACIPLDLSFLPSLNTAGCFHHGLPALSTRFSHGSGLPKPQPGSARPCALTSLASYLSIASGAPAVTSAFCASVKAQSGVSVRGILPQPRAAQVGDSAAPPLP